MHTQTETHKSPLARYLILILALTAALIAGTALDSGQQVFAADSSTTSSSAPTKTVTDNGDGTYTLKLSVTGQSSATTVTTPTEAVLVMDISGSMNDAVKTTSYQKVNTPSDPYDDDYYGLVDGQYVELYYDWWTQKWTYTDDNGDDQTYSGDFYTASTTSQTRLAAAKSAAKTMVKQLLDSGVSVKLVTFSTKANAAQTLTSSNYVSVIDGLTADGGTNWEAALTNAKNALSSSTTSNKNVIFMSDGNPTFRSSANGYRWDYNYRSGVYGTGNSDPNNRNYNAAKTVANKIVKTDKAEFYSIGVFGNVSNMQNLAKDAYDDQSTEKNYYSASDSASLQAAFADIVQSIKNTISRTHFNVTDTLTENTDSAVTENATFIGSAGNFKYEITDADGKTTVYNAATDGAATVGEATVSDKTISWKPNTPPNGQTYSVSVIIWPNQDAVDQAAKTGDYTLETNYGTNNQATYDEVKTTTQSNPEDGIQDLIEKNGNYIYSYNYNGTDKQITLKPDGQGVYTATDGSRATLQQKDGVWTLTVPNVTKFTSGEMAVSAASTTLRIDKVWENDATSHDHDKITVKIVTTEDGQDKDYLSGTIDNSDQWKTKMAVAPGLKAYVNGKLELLNAGHTYKLSEPSLDTAHYTVSYSDDGFKTGFTPMIVNGQLEGLPNGSTSLTITNTRKEIKTGVKNTDNTAPMVGAGLALAALAAVFVFKRKLGR